MSYWEEDGEELIKRIASYRIASQSTRVDRKRKKKGERWV